MKVFKKKNIKRLASFLLIILLFICFSNVSLAADRELGGLSATAQPAGYNTGQTSGDIPYKIGLIINVFLSLLGVIFMILVFMGAFAMISAGGNEETVKASKQRIKTGAIGLLIILSAYFVSTSFLNFVGKGVFKGADLTENQLAN